MGKLKLELCVGIADAAMDEPDTETIAMFEIETGVRDKLEDAIVANEVIQLNMWDDDDLIWSRNFFTIGGGNGNGAV